MAGGLPGFQLHGFISELSKNGLFSGFLMPPSFALPFSLLCEVSFFLHSREIMLFGIVSLFRLSNSVSCREVSVRRFDGPRSINMLLSITIMTVITNNLIFFATICINDFFGIFTFE